MPQAGLISQYQFLSFDGGAYSNQGRNLKTWWNFEDFIGGFEASAQDNGIWASFASGAGANVFGGAGTTLRPGLLSLATGTTITGNSTLYSGRGNQQPILFGAGVYTFETDVYIPTLSTVGEEYILRIGFGDTTNGADFVDGAYFEYDRLGFGTNWRYCTASNSIRSKADLGQAVSAGVWTRLKIVVNVDGTFAYFYFNGQLLASSFTNLPTGAGRETSLVFNIIKSAGTTTRSLNIDWAWLHMDLSASR